MAHTTVWHGDNPLGRTWSFLKNFWGRIQRNDYLGLAAEMAYHFMLAFVPLLIFLVSLFGIISADSGLLNNMLGYLQRVTPSEAYGIIERSMLLVTRESSGGIALIGLLTALWTSSNGAMVIIKGMNRAYQCDDDDRPFWKKRLVAIELVAGMGIILLVCSNLLVFGGYILDAVNRYLPVEATTLNLINMLRWVVGLGALMLITNYIYAIGPNYKEGPLWKHTWVGTITFILMWGLLSWLFSLYVSNMGRYSEVYGPLGAVVVLMIWLYLTSLVLLIGGEVNAFRNECVYRRK